MKTCKNCKKRSSCKEICSKIESFISQKPTYDPFYWEVQVPFSELDKLQVATFTRPECNDESLERFRFLINTSLSRKVRNAIVSYITNDKNWSTVARRYKISMRGAHNRYEMAKAKLLKITKNIKKSENNV